MVTSQRFLSNLDQLPAMRCFLREAWHRGQQALGDSLDRTEEMHELELALQEAASNVIIHAYARQPDRPIVMDVEREGERVTVILRHQGRGFDRSLVPAPRFDANQFGGYGVYLIEQLVDQCDYLCETSNNHQIRMVKHLEPAALQTT